MSQKDKKFKPRGMPAKKNKAMDDEMSINEGQIPNNISPNKKNKGMPMEGIAQVQDENMEFEGKRNTQSLSQDILREGFIQSYIDFFSITRQTLEDEYSNQLEYSENQLIDLKNQLCYAEAASRYQNINKTKAIEGYYRLAEQFFEDKRDYDKAGYFYQRVIKISKAEEEDKWEGQGQLGYGKCLDKLGDINQAILILEKSLSIAERKEISSLVDQISQELIKIYNKMAQQYENEGEQGIQAALKYYQKNLDVAKKLREPAEQGNICHKMGLLFYKDGQYEKARDYQQEYLRLSNEDAFSDKTNKQMFAYAALAKCYIKLNQTDEALQNLNKYYNSAINQHNAKSDAALHLATLYAQKGDIEKSNQFYKEHFKEAKDEKSELKDRKLVDRARVTVGIALANASIDKHIELVKNSDKNLKALLDWKSKRSDANK